MALINLQLTRTELVTLRQACLALETHRREQAKTIQNSLSGTGATAYVREYTAEADKAAALYTRLAELT